MVNFPVHPHEVSITAQRILSDTLGEQVASEHIKVVQIRPLRAVAICDKRFVVKIAGPELGLTQSTQILRLVGETTSIPVPKVLASCNHFNGQPLHYLISTYLPGQEWSSCRSDLSNSDKNKIYQQLGELIGQLHTVQISGFGVMLHHDMPVYLPTLYRRAESLIKSQVHLDLFKHIFQVHESLFKSIEKPELTHDDLHGHNILIQQKQGKWEISGILDFDKAWSGHGESDLARLAIWDMATAYFWRGYNGVHQVDEHYEDRRSIYQLLWCLEYARETTQHLKDTARVCHALGIEPITTFV